MPYNCVSTELLRIMENHLLQGSPSLLDELYEFGEISGRLSKTSILLMWNGTPLDKFSVPDIVALFEFLNSKFNIGNAKEFFSTTKNQETATNTATDGHKQEYLDSIENTGKRRVVASVLNRVSKNIESVFQKNICEMTEDELIAGLNNMGYINTRVASNEISNIKKYLEWCSQKGYCKPDNNAIQKISVKSIETKKNLWQSIVPTPEKLNTIIKYTSISSEVITGGVIVCLYWLGLSFDEIYGLEENAINLHERTIQHPHFGEIKIPDELIGIFVDYENNDIIYTQKGDLIADKTKYFIRKYVRHGAKNKGSRLSEGRINALVQEVKENYEGSSGEHLRITGTSLGISGACWRLYQQEKGGKILTDEAYYHESRATSVAVLEEIKSIYQQYKKMYYGETHL